MATNRRVLAVPCAIVWETWSDGPRYADWVVGTARIRAVDERWPGVGSRLHYTVGLGPFRRDGHTEVLAVEDGRRLELEAHAWPAGSVRIELSLSGDDDSCDVTMVEHPLRGRLATLHNPVGDALLKLRNVVTLRRLDRLARRRAAQRRAGQ